MFTTRKLVNGRRMHVSLPILVVKVRCRVRSQESPFGSLDETENSTRP